jgi:hypothetical protein
MPKPVRRIVDWAVIGFIVIGSFYLSSTGPSRDTNPPSEIFLPLPDDLATFRCPAGYMDPEFAGGGIVCQRNNGVFSASLRCRGYLA